MSRRAADPSFGQLVGLCLGVAGGVLGLFWLRSRPPAPPPEPPPSAAPAAAAASAAAPTPVPGTRRPDPRYAESLSMFVEANRGAASGVSDGTAEPVVRSQAKPSLSSPAVKPPAREERSEDEEEPSEVFTGAPAADDGGVRLLRWARVLGSFTAGFLGLALLFSRLEGTGKPPAVLASASLIGCTLVIAVAALARGRGMGAEPLAWIVAAAFLLPAAIKGLR